MPDVPANKPANKVDTFLERVRTQTRPRLIFALDATHSRQPSWDMACSLQAEMFDEVGKLGGLDVQLVYYRGGSECRASHWTSDAHELAQKMRQNQCMAGQTQIGKVLSHIRREHALASVAAAVFIGDAVEEPPSQLYDAAGLGVPLYMLQEGNDKNVADVFKQLAHLTHGAHLQFRPGAARELADLLRAIAVVAAGGVKALADLNSDAARKLLGQMKK